MPMIGTVVQRDSMQTSPEYGRTCERGMASGLAGWNRTLAGRTVAGLSRRIGTSLRVIGVNIDITDRKRAEESAIRTYEALQRQHRTLQHLLQSSDHERQTIAYEIHDELAQQLTGAIMQFEVLPLVTTSSRPNHNRLWTPTRRE